MYPFKIRNDDPDVQFDISKDVNLKEDEVLICIGIASGNNSPKKPAWKTVRFSTKDLTEKIFDGDIVWFLSTALNLSAIHHGWVSLD